MNRKNPALKHQNTVDRMRKKMILNKGGSKICLILLIKNKVDTVNELLDSLKSVIDTISIIKFNDDAEINSIVEWGKNNDKLTKINMDQFKNLPYNKTNSIKISKNAFPDSDYFLLSELDFIWNTNNFDKLNLTEDKYDIIQGDDYYRSTKLLSAKINWTCHLQTYEYWTNDKINEKGCLLKTLSIENNVEDYEQKIKLLLEDINIPNISKYDKSRVKFYLGYVSEKLAMFEDSIKYCSERIEEGGDKEEIYYSLYNIGICYEKLGWKMKDCDVKNLEESAKMFQQAVYFYKKAYEFRPTRSESLYNLSKLYRSLAVEEMYMFAYQTIIIGNKIKCPTDSLLVNKACYDYLFDVELSIVTNLIPDKKSENKEIIAKLINRNDIPEKIKETIIK